MMHAANTVTELHIAWVDVLTAETSTYVVLPTFCTAEWLRVSRIWGEVITSLACFKTGLPTVFIQKPLNYKDDTASNEPKIT